MNKRGTTFFLYHEIQAPQRELCSNDPGYVRYVLSSDEFRDHLGVIKNLGWSGWNVTRALQSMASVDGKAQEQEGICLTFDDGCASDLLVAAPLLLEKGFNATFYITVNHLGQKGYLSRVQLQDLHKLGFEIGSHSMTHRYLNDLDPRELESELSGSKQELEQIIGSRVIHFSCPGGRVNQRVLEATASAGYESIATSRPGRNKLTPDDPSLNRTPILRGTSAAEFASLCRGELPLGRQVQSAVLGIAKRVLGNSMYDKVRFTLLRQG